MHAGKQAGTQGGRQAGRVAMYRHQRQLPVGPFHHLLQPGHAAATEDQEQQRELCRQQQRLLWLTCWGSTMVVHMHAGRQRAGAQAARQAGSQAI
jgi:hypothetical protein